MSLRNAVQAQLGLEDVERILRRTLEEARSENAAQNYGVSQADVDEAIRLTQRAGRAVGKLHDHLSQASQDSTIPGVAELGQKGDD